MKNSIKLIISLTIFILPLFINAQENSNLSNDEFELTGTLSCDISSPTGMVSSIAITIGNGGDGDYKSIMTGDITLPTHTVYRPKNLNSFGKTTKLPIVVFGNGGCRNSSGEFRNFLSEIASHGFLVIAIGPVSNALLSGSEVAGGGSNPQMLLDAIDWAIAENNRTESSFFNKIDIKNIAVMGQSCGGLQALFVSNDPRVTTTLIWNSGLFATPISMPEIPAKEEEEEDATINSAMNVMPVIPKSDLENLHAPIAYFTGGSTDMATLNAEDDFKYINQVPVFHASYDFSDEVEQSGYQGYGHYPATYREPNGGDFAIAGVAWLNWQLKGDNEAAKMFKGNPCRIMENTKWTIKKKNID